MKNKAPVADSYEREPTMPKVRSRRRSAFTLIELLIAIAIMAILVGLLLAGIYKIKASAATAACASKMRELGLALHGYHDVHHSFPLPAGAKKDSWMFKILPHIEQANLH